MLDKELIDILACPSCKGNVFEEDNNVVCKDCGLKYPIEDDIPIMLVEKGKK